jgi:hypothetical protein
MMLAKKLFVIVLFILCATTVLAHEDAHINETAVPEVSIDSLKDMALDGIIIASVFVSIVTIIAIVFRKKTSDKGKWVLFLLIVIPTVVVTLFSAGSTFYINHVSVTGGPVHWHADFEIWDCGETVNLIDPTGLINRIGNPVLHEHNDFRIHVEGTVIKEDDVSLPEFFSVIGGSLDEVLRVPTEKGDVTVGNKCDGELQIFVYSVDAIENHANWKYTQRKLANVDDYVMTPHSNVPPGDCIIIEYGAVRDQTDRICESYTVAEQRGELRGS